MKRSTATPVSKKSSIKKSLVVLALLMAVSTPLGLMQSRVFADRFDDQIAAYQREIAGYQARAAELNAQAKTLQSALDILTAEKATIQAQVDLSQAKYDKLVSEIAITEKRIADNKDALGEILADMYVDGEISPLEMLASSKNIGDYVDKQEYRASIQESLSSTIKEIDALKKQLEQQKVDVERVLADQKAQRDALAAKEAEQAKLLADTQGQEAAYQQLSTDRNQKIEQLRSQQAAEIAERLRKYGGGSYVIDNSGNGGYPAMWANAAPDTIGDYWGMLNRECVSYVAFKVHSTYDYMPYWGGDRFITYNGQRVFVSGHAKYWLTMARAAGIPTGSTPRQGAVGVTLGGPYGHVAWVDSVNSDGTINISQYNAYPDIHRFSRWYNLSPNFFEGYIYFG